MKPDSTFWADSLRLIGLIAAVTAGRYFSKDQFISGGLLVVALLILVWSLVRVFRFLRRSPNLRGYLGVFGVGTYILSGLFGLGLVVNFVLSLLKGDLSPWWFWPAGVVAILALMMIAGNLLRLVDKNN